MSPQGGRKSDDNQENPFKEEFEDDLNEDWESAFQTDDFMFSQEETEDPFRSGNGGTEDVDLSTLMESRPEEEFPQGKKGVGPGEKNGPQSPTLNERELDELSKESRTRLLSPKVLLLAIPLAAAAVLAFFMLPRTSPPPGKQAAVKVQENRKSSAFEDDSKKTELKPKTAEKTSPPAATAPLKQTFLPLPDEKIRKRYSLPPIFVTATAEEDNSIFVSAEITLVLQIAPDEILTEKEKIRVSDIIYQFFKNRPGQELDEFALDRGKMIKGIQEWAGKNWPDGPLTSLIIESYRVDKS